MTLSLLDRLTDLDPDSQKEARLSHWEELRQSKAALYRDLAVLLNTRRAEKDFPADYEESTNSLLSFGVLGFTSYDLKSGPDPDRVRRSIERAIRQFEPRLARVSVTLEELDPARPVLQFQIEALRRIGPADEPVTFGAALSRESRRVAVSGGNA